MKENALPSRGESAKSVANRERLEALGRAIDGRAATPSRSPRRRHWPRRLAIGAAALAFVIVAGAVGDYFYLGSLVHHKHVNFLQSAGASENLLLVGSTDRCALKHQSEAYGLCSQGVTGINSDITMILHLNPSTGAAALLSIPRDTFIPNARTFGANKIDAALYQGPSQLADAIEEDFGIPINHYVELNFGTFASVVNALGGIDMYFPVPVYDGGSGLAIFHPGCYQLDGYHALQVVRARHLQIQPTPGNKDYLNWPQEGLSDIARIRRTHEFLRVLASKVAANGLSNPITDQRLATSVIGNLQVDQNFSEGHMVSLAQKFANINVGSLPQLTYPVAGVNGGSYLYKGYYYGDVVFPINPTGTTTIEQIFGVKPNQNSFTYAPLPAPTKISVSVENGSNTNGQAATVAAALHRQGFVITSTGTRTPVGIANETVVYYGGPAPLKTGNWKSPGLAAAQAVMRRLGGAVVMAYDPTQVVEGSLVTVLTGNGLTVLTPPKPVKKPTGATTSSTVVTTTTLPANPQLEPTTPTSQGLQPWDPRACSPGQHIFVDKSA
jgi:LCP family protein required for cell wall assembly